MAVFSNKIRWYIFIFSVLLSAGMWLFVSTSVTPGNPQLVKLTQLYALTAVFYLYITLAASPFTKIFSSFPLNALYIHARRAFGLSAFYFALLHASLAFFGQLGGFVGLSYLPPNYLFPIILSATALCILATLASTSSDFMVKKLTSKKWKLLHRLVYVAGFLILLHALLLGSHFVNLYTPIPTIFLVGLTALLIGESFRIDLFLVKRFSIPPYIVAIILSIIIIIVLQYFYRGLSINIHGVNK